VKCFLCLRDWQLMGGLVTADRRCRILLGLVFACGGGGCTGVVVFDSYYYCS